jgi:hypothetical protein
MTMFLQRTAAISFVLLLTPICWQCARAQAQINRPQQAAGTTADAQENERRAILDSDRWRRAYRTFHGWLAVQQVYTAEQLAAVRAELAARVAQMTPAELEEFLKDMEERLEVLTSPEAEDARQWLAQFLAVARNPEAQLRRSRPDVLNMTASQIREEIRWLEQHRLARQQAHAASSQGRALQQQSARGLHDARRQAQGLAAESRSRAAANAQFRSHYAPLPQDRPNFSDLRPKPMGPPIYSVSPWGTPIYWHPMAGQW